MAARDLHLMALLGDFPEESRVLEGQGGLARERFDELGRSSRELPGRATADDERAEDALLAEERHHEHGQQLRHHD